MKLQQKINLIRGLQKIHDSAKHVDDFLTMGWAQVEIEKLLPKKFVDEYYKQREDRYYGPEGKEGLK